MDAEIRYLYHSGFAVKTAGHFLVFDYYHDTPRGGKLSAGVINPAELRDENVLVFASHSHPDHYSPRIFSWRKEIGQIRYVMANEIRTKEDCVRMKAGQTCDLGDVTVRALDSTDIGCAFLVKTDGLCIYHAGDLNWWHWEGEPEADNLEMARRYREQIDTLSGENIDIAFIPVDSRLEANCVLGLDYFMKAAGAAMIVPMHAFGNPSFYDTLKTDPRVSGYLDRITFYRERGETIPYTKNT